MTIAVSTDLESGNNDGQDVVDDIESSFSAVKTALETQQGANAVRDDLISTALVASPTQTQAGGIELVSQFNFIETVDNAGDSARLRTLAAGLRMVVFNSGANEASIFPPVGADLGEGIDQPLTLAAGTSATFLAESATVCKSLLSLSPDTAIFEFVAGLLTIKDEGINTSKIAGHGAASDDHVLTKAGWIDNSGAGITLVPTAPASPEAGRAYMIADIDSLRIYQTANTYWTFSGTKVDGDAPTVESVSLAADGVTYTVTFNEAIAQGASYSDSHWTLNVTPSKTVNLTFDSISGPDLILTGDASVYDDETVTLDHDGTANSVEDLAGNDVAAFAGQAITNNSEQGLSGFYSEDWSLVPDGTDLDSLSDWALLDTIANGFEVKSSKIVTVISDTFGGNQFDGAINADHFIKANVGNGFGTGRFAYLYCRYTDSNNYYRVSIRSATGAIELGVMDAGSYSTINTYTNSDDADYRLRALGTGPATRLTLEVDTGGGWASVFTDVDPGAGNYVDGGTVGMAGNRNSVSFDNIVVGNL